MCRGACRKLQCECIEYVRKSDNTYVLHVDICTIISLHNREFKVLFPFLLYLVLCNYVRFLFQRASPIFGYMRYILKSVPVV